MVSPSRATFLNWAPREGCGLWLRILKRHLDSPTKTLTHPTAENHPTQKDMRGWSMCDSASKKVSFVRKKSSICVREGEGGRSALRSIVEY